jgi:hypothetical protein
MNSIQTTQTVDGIISSIYRQQERQGEIVMDAMAKNFWPMIGKANQVAYTAIEDADDAMRDKGVLEAELMVDLFGSVLDGSLSGFSYRERWYIGVIGRVAYQRTIKKLQACSG